MKIPTLVTGVKLIAVAIVTVVLFVIVINAMRNPVSQQTHSYTAEFTDVSGLNVNGDVRSKGLRIGKVTGVDLERRGSESLALVHFTLDRDYQLTDTSRLAIRYQNLTGTRYLDFESGGSLGASVTHVPTSATTPSFDITQLFNGLQPVLATMNTSQVNQFASNAIAVLEGDGSGLGPLLDNAQTLASFASDRQQVISTLAQNISRISEVMGGRSDSVMDFLRAISLPIGNALAVIDEFPKMATFGPALIAPLVRALEAAGLTEDLDIQQLVDGAFSSMTDAVESFRLMPSTLAGIQLGQNGVVPASCSNGPAILPTDVRVLLGGSEVLLCNAQ